MNDSTQTQTNSPAAVADPDHPHRYTAALAETIETRWQKHWEAQGTFHTPDPGDSGFDAARPKFYCLDMFPYPSGAGLHVGHPEGYTATDIICRYKRHRGFNVLHPMGWDAFGLPAEQYAIQTGIHPAVTTRQAIENFRRQLKRFGFSYDWSREFATIDEDYYKWTQWIWLKAYHAWYDPDENRARPISELTDEFSSGKRRVRLNPSAAEYTGAGDLPDGTRLDPWIDVDEDIKRMIVDSYRLAYTARQTVNWCPKLGTALANEEVIDGRSERGGYPVFRQPLTQWMFRITAFADRLLDDLDLVDWPESTRAMQRQWIGRSEGAEVDFPLLDENQSPMGPSLRVFTTRPDTIFGATYMVVAPEHPMVDGAIEMAPAGADVRALSEYVEQARNRSDVERQESKAKTGVFTGLYVRNPATGQAIPVWTSDYVLMGYGTGAIMAVPGEDTRDWEFAEAFGLPIVRTVQPPDDFKGGPYLGDGPAINSANDEVSLNGLHMDEAKTKIIDWLQSKRLGMRRVNYKLRDWLFSRQRYWGEPFPVVYDEHGEHYPVDEANLPVTLPPLEDYQPVESDTPQPMLAKAEDWVHTTAGAAGVSRDVLPPDTPVTRETNTMPGWAGSCWYYLRFCDPRNDDRCVGRDNENYWMGGGDDSSNRAGVDLYIGGAEHAVLHLLYARFWHKVLYDLGEVSTPEPFKRLFHQGMITSWAYQRADRSLVPIDEVEPRGEQFVTKDTGEPVVQITAKMSKSLRNVINPDDVITEYGADTFRLYEMYMGPLDQTKPWNPRDIIGVFRFLQRAWRNLVDEKTGELRPRILPHGVMDDDEVLKQVCQSEGFYMEGVSLHNIRHRTDVLEKKFHRCLAEVTKMIDDLHFNTAIAKLIEFNNELVSGDQASLVVIPRKLAEDFVITLSPFAPHMSEELWSKLGHAQCIAYAPWPEVDEAMLRDDAIEMPVQIMGKVRGKVTVPADADPKAVEELALNDARVKELLEGKTVRKVIVVPGKIVNIVAN